MKKSFCDSAIREKVCDFIARHGNIVSSTALLKTFLKIHCDDEGTARTIILPLLKGDRRFEYIESAGWRLAEQHPSQPSLTDRIYTIFAANIAESGRWKGTICEASFVRIEGKKEQASFHIGLLAQDPVRRPGMTIKDAYRIVEFVKDGVIVHFEPFSGYRQLQVEVGNKTGIVIANEILSLKKLMSNLFGLKRNADIEEAAQALGISVFSADSAEVRARMTVEIFHAILEHLTETGVVTFSELKILEERKGEGVDLSRFGLDESFLESIPEKPGTYRFLDANHSPIYVGKAKNLRRRISSYFLSFNTLPPKIESLYASLKQIEYEETGSELEAILREAELISSLKPPLNKQFEIHERTAQYGKTGNLVIVLPAVDEREAVCYFIKDKRLIKSFRIRKRKAELDRIRNFLKRNFFSPKRSSHTADSCGQGSESKRKRKSEREGKGPDIDIELISSYLGQKRESVNWFDPTDHRSPADALRVIASYLQTEDLESGRVIHI